MHRNDEIKARLLATFQVEAREHVQTINGHLAALAGGLPFAEALPVVEGMFRATHTLKGAARSVGLVDAEALCQALESVLRQITNGDLVLSRPLLDAIQETADGIARVVVGEEVSVAVNEFVSRLERAAAEPVALGTELTTDEGSSPETPGPLAEPASATPPPAERQSGIAVLGGVPTATIRVTTDRLDALLLQVEDLLLPKLAAGERVREARRMVEALARCRQSANGDLAASLRALEMQVRQALGHLVHDERTIARAVDALQEDVRRLRISPASLILDVFSRMARDLARELGKDVGVVIQGSDLEVDRRILEAIKDPLIHLVRNAIDHGIEPPEERARVNKPARGRVVVSFLAREAHRIEVCVEDDGSGIKLDQVRAAAVRSRLLTLEDAQALEDAEALDLLFRSGFSTSPIISRVSGHGLGLTIVKERVEHLGGRVLLETRAGAGTTVRLQLPATIATFSGLLVRDSGQPFLLPIESVEQTIRLSLEKLQRVEGRPVIRWHDRPVPVSWLSQLLGLARRHDQPEPGRLQPCVILSSGDEELALIVDEIMGDREVLVKEMGPPLVRVRNVAGAGILGTRELVLILRPADLLRSAQAASSLPPPRPVPKDEERPAVILVVDDSITTRAMEKNMLETTGYQVQVAVDGMEAWTILKSERCDLVVSDVDMPRMDGFELTARMRADAKLADLPIILVTALESREDKERGILAGANAYVVKSSFEESNLLEIVRRLL